MPIITFIPVANFGDQSLVSRQTKSFKKLYFDLFFSIFDKDDDGYIPVHEMREILQSLGDKMTDKELDEMMKAASSDREGFINYDGRHIYFRTRKE